MARAAESARQLTIDIDEWEVDAVAYLNAKFLADEAKRDMESHRRPLMKALADLGEEDDNGHRTLYLSHPVDKWGAVTRQRRVSVGQDDQAIEAILTRHGLKERCVKMVPQVDEDAIMACVYEGLLTEEEVYEMFPQKVTYALVAVKA